LRHPASADWVEIDDANEGHIARHGVTPVELQQMLDNDPLWSRNKNGMTAEWRVIGRTNGGRPLVAAVTYDEQRNCIRPITARTCTDTEIAKWRI
jgi:uncharacterized DUF497 family protein